MAVALAVHEPNAAPEILACSPWVSAQAPLPHPSHSFGSGWTGARVPKLHMWQRRELGCLHCSWMVLVAGKRRVGAEHLVVGWSWATCIMGLAPPLLPVAHIAHHCLWFKGWRRAAHIVYTAEKCKQWEKGRGFWGGGGHMSTYPHSMWPQVCGPHGMWPQLPRSWTALL